MDEIIRKIKSGDFGAVYFLQGDEPYFIDMITEAIEKHALQEHEKSFNFTVLYGRDSTMNDILSNARRFPMMAERQVVMVREAQYLNDLKREEEYNKLLAYLDNPVPSTVLVFCYMGKKLDGRLTLGKQIKKKAILFTSDRIYENQVPAWIDSYLRQRKVSIDPKANALLTEYIGNNLERLSNELNKILINHNKEGFVITDKEIETYVGINKDYNIFEFQNALLQRDAARIFRILKYFEANEKDNPPIASVAVTFSTLMKLLLTFTLPKPDAFSISKLLGMNQRFAANYARARTIYGYGHIVNAIDLLEKADAKLKGVGGGTSSKNAVFREFVVKFLHS